MASIARSGPVGFGVIFAALASAQAPLQIPFNNTASHGPDGPWNFITLSVGSGPGSNVDFYPMLSDSQNILVTQDVCSNNKSQCISPAPNYYDAKSSSATDNPQNISVSNVTVGNYNGGLADQLTMTGEGYYYVETINNLPMKAGNISSYISNNITFKDTGNEPFYPISLLSIEANTNNSPLRTSTGNATDQTLLEAYANETGGSLSWGIHMGSAAFNQTGSLYFGGYDQNRIIEEPAMFPSFGFVPLNNISFGFASGNSPWANVEDLPADFLDGQTQVILSPHVPHIYLSQQTCNIISEYLPVNYDPDSNLYLWNTSDPAYKDIVTSPSYLNFTFGDSQTTSIRVPFALLNLTLTAPIKDKPTQYFPCSPHGNLFNLGRAFLQAAFLMQGYTGAGTIIAAQAPGPAIGNSEPNPVSIFQSNPTASPPANAPKWEDTWSGILTPLGAAPTLFPTGTASAVASANSSSSGGGLSGGAIAGIVVGVVVGVGLIAGAAVFFFLRHRRSSRVSESGAGPETRGASVGTSVAAAAVAAPGSAHSDRPPTPPPKEKEVFYRSSSSARSMTASPSTMVGSGAQSTTGMSSSWGIMPVAGTATTAAGGAHEIETSETARRHEMDAGSPVPTVSVAHELPGDTGTTTATTTAATTRTISRNGEPVELDAGGVRLFG